MPIIWMFQHGELDEDPRLKVLRKEWFEGKDCLDIGCNSGILTIQIGSSSFLLFKLRSSKIHSLLIWNLLEIKLEIYVLMV